ncbi:hypothetical protein VOLCADRAFT_99345 [Volvox carteri f. nagariensis]|uniref:Uncharacterized protein n=1 Tax=Volvox carteri f. nagariensis TaxID=3068 RepID=D8UHK8_VOLCA|nr:uncharacterized protein VOLCADRAFT_99345 [Volvox carteri f. nagariensis]EFJ40761.1 hypothetical protein VOLCADRAFT_99345 [Volvox carteri f. nagariensis]|eukprot:XP_002958136.1 hypothetical protein VOLCADRAFT_99345 [Volvox carteri f. nagariensis]
MHSVHSNANFKLNLQCTQRVTSSYPGVGSSSATERDHRPPYRLWWCCCGCKIEIRQECLLKLVLDLQEAVHEQGNRLEEALAKDPLAGRHEIMRQEAMKLARSLNVNRHHFTVREWQTMKHNDLRAQQAREELERRLQDRDKRDKSHESDQDRPAWNSLYWSQNDYVRRPQPKPEAVQQGSSKPGSSPGSSPGRSKPAGARTAETEAEDEAAEATAAPARAGPIVPVPAGLLGAFPAAPSETGDDSEMPRVVRPLAAYRPGAEPAEWRLRILRAKRKAMMVISVVLAFRGRKYRARGLQRLDSLSYFIAQHLGTDLERFVEEQGTYRVTRALAEEVWREKNHRDMPQSPMFDADPDESSDPIPTVTFAGSSRGPLPSPAFKAPPSPQQQQQQRLPAGTSGGGGPSSTGPPGAGRAGSPLLRSRPINLTPTLHHTQTAGAGATPALPTASSSGAGGAGSSRSALPAGAASGGGAAATAGTAGVAAGGGAGTGSSSPLPVLRGQSERRSSGLVPPPGLEGESSAGTVAAGGNATVSLAGGKNIRFSAPGSEVGPGAAGEDDGTVSTSDAVPALSPTAAAATAASGNGGKRWESPRFARRTGGEFGEVKVRHSIGPTNASGISATVLRRPSAIAMLTDDTATVARARSWNGPPGGQPVPHARSAGPDNTPSPPSPMGRQLRKHRESGLGLTGSASTTSLPQAGVAHPAVTRSPTASADGYIHAPAAVTAAAARNKTSRYNGGGVVRIASATPSSGGGAAARRAGRVRGSAPGDGDRSVLRSVSPYAERPRSVAGARALRCSSTIRRMVHDGSSDQLFLRYQEEAAALERPLRMMHLFANRANARWVEELAGSSSPPVSHSNSYNTLTAVGGTTAGNAAAVPSGPGWEPPHVYDGTRFSASVGAAQASVFRAEVATMLRAGRMAVQVLAGEEYITMGDGQQQQALWDADPWDLIATTFPAKVAAADRVRHVHMGPRLLMALVAAVEALAGPEAVSRLVVVLHVNDAQKTEVVRELRFRKFCGLRPENLVLVVQQRRPGYYWDPVQTIFVPDPNSPPVSAGSGYALMQLVWPEEALRVARDTPRTSVVSKAEAPSWASAGGSATAAATAAAAAAVAEPPPLVPLGMSVLDFMAQRGIEWLLTRRLRDINLYNPDLTLDSEVLSYMLYLHDHMGANIGLQVEVVDSLTAARAAQTGVVMAPPRQRRTNSTGSGAAAAAAASALSSSMRLGAPLPPRRAATYTTGGGAGAGPGPGGGPYRAGSDVGAVSQPEGGSVGAGPGGPLHPHMVVDVKNSDLGTPRTIQLLTELRTQAKGKLAVSTRRYLWRVDVLQSLIQRSSIFHPSLEVAGDVAYLTFDMADLTAATEWGARCVAVSAGGRPIRNLNTLSELEDLLIAVQAQDAHAPFRRLAGNVTPAFGLAHGATDSPHAPHAITLHPAVIGGGGGGAAAGGQDPSASSPTSGAGVGPVADLRNIAPGQCIVILVAENESTSMAVQLVMALVKPGRDRVVLVTVVPSVLQESAGRLLLRKHEMSIMKTMVDVSAQLLTKNPGSNLIDQLEAFIDDVGPQLVVMGSQMLATSQGLAHGQAAAMSSSGGAGGGGGAGASLGSLGAIYSSGASFSGGAGGGSHGGAGSTVLGSITVSMLRNLTRPMLIVKANAKFASLVWDKDKLRMLLEVHHSSRNMLRYVCSKLVTPTRHDKIFLTRGGARDASQMEITTSRRLLENFSDIATQYKVSAVKRALEEPFESGAIKWAEHDKVHLIAVHAPAGRGLANSTFQILRAARSAVLVYKSNDPN